MSRRYWWVNQKQTYEQERAGSFLWSPKRKANGHRNPFYDFMRVVAPGDVVLSYANRRIPSYGIILSHCYEAPKPAEFGRAGENWDNIGWRVDVAYTDFDHPLRPADHIQVIGPLLPEKYSPLRPNGHGLQSVYLTELPQRLMAQLSLLIGPPLLDVLEKPPLISRDIAREDNPVQERWERRIVQDIRALAALPATEREQIIDARVGQGRFRGLVLAHEHCCRVTRVDRPEHLIASHIRPWRHADNRQRLDPENGFMLTPNVDHLFDRGFITFSRKGKLVFSPAVDRESVLRMGFDPDAQVDVGGFSRQQREYLEFHQDEVFLGRV